MEWIHCNQCCRQPRRSDNNFIMTSCGHIFCRRCENRENVDTCLGCKTKCRITQLSGSVKPEIKVYFEDVGVKLKALGKIVRFQKHHSISLNKKYSRMLESYKSCKKENDLLRKKLVEVQKRIHSMKKNMEEYNQQKASKNNKMFPAHLHYSPTTASLNNPHTPAQDIYENTHAAFQYIQPHLKKYSHYKINETPTNKTPVLSAASRFAQSFHRKVVAPTPAKPQKKSDVHEKSQQNCYHIPSYDALKERNMNGFRRHRR